MMDTGALTNISSMSSSSHDSDVGASPSPGPTEPGGHTCKGADSERPSPTELLLCAQMLGVDQSRIVVAGNHDNGQTVPSSVVLFKAVGNHPDLDFTLSGEGSDGFCLFESGNNPNVSVHI